MSKIETANGTVAQNAADETRTIVAHIEDEGFGIVNVYYYKDLNVIKADGLEIYNVPTDYNMDDVMTAWNLFTGLYHTYSCLMLEYDDIKDEKFMFEMRKCVA